MSKRKMRLFAETFKLEVLREMYSTGASRNSICKKYEISSTLLRFWIRKYPIDSELLSLPQETIKSCTKMVKEPVVLTDEEVLQQKIEDLRRSLEYEKMRSRALEKMIEIAEREEGISILKKDGAKQ